jgi:LysM repeat protein
MNISYKPLIVALFLGVAGLASGIWSLPKQNVVEVRGVLGGPSVSAGPSQILIGVAQGAEMTDSAALTQNASAIMSNTADESAQGGPSGASDPSYANGAIEDPGQPIGAASAGAPAGVPLQAVTYTVKAGDTLSGIAAHFNTSVSNIITANPSVHKKALQVGQTLQIASASGAPNDSPAGASDTPSGTLPNFNSNFIMPAQGYDWGILHNYNAVDIANACGTPVVASADGLVVPDPNIPDVLGDWNGGYGNFVYIEHPFGTGIYTRYAHLEQILVQVGDYVKQGQEIGLMGDTGDSTGCHVHFEVIGAQQPFAK